jgi:hypothetical protein
LQEVQYEYTIGKIWEQRLQELVEVQKSSLRATARALKVDARTINRYVDKLKLDPSWRSPRVQQTPTLIEDNTRPEDRYRQKWLNLQITYPNASKTDLRKRDPGLYARLYREDRGWLNENSPSLQYPVATHNRVNWQERDRQIEDRVREAVTQLLDSEVPQRITIGRIGKMTDLKAILETKLDKLPLTRTYLSEVVESVETFQNRRIQWALDELDRRGEEVRTWKVMRLAGLREEEFDRVERVVLSARTNVF